MKLFLVNLLVAVLWDGLTGRYGVANLFLGFLVGHGAFYLVYLLTPGQEMGDYLRRSRKLMDLALFFLWELLLSNLKVARDVLSPRIRHRPAILAVPLQARTDLEITLLSILLILTPGTLLLDVDEDAHLLFIHVLDAPDPEALRREVREGFERRILEVTR